MKVKLIPDDDPQSPREWDNLGVMVCFHKRYNLGDKTDLRSSMFEGWQEIYDHLVKEKDAAVVLPLFLMDHSGITMRTSAHEFSMCDAAGWDWGQVGFIYATREGILKEYKRKRITDALRQKVVEVLQSEVKVYDQYISGDCWGYVIENDEGEQLDSCWGYFGQQDAAEAAEEAKKYLLTQEATA